MFEATSESSKVNLSIESFPQEWRHKLDLTDEQFTGIWKDARSFHTGLAYHNFGHTIETLWEAMRLADLCENHGLNVNRKALFGATLYHDSRFQEDHKALGYISKEALSAATFVDQAPDFGFDREDIVASDHAIAATRAGEIPESLEDKILVRADLKNVFEDYSAAVVPSTLRLLKEASQLHPGINRQRFIPESIKILASYFVNDLSLGEFEKDSWAQRPISNLIEMVNEFTKVRQIPPLEFIRKLGSSAVVKLLGEHFNAENKSQV